MQPVLNAFTHVLADDALARAKELEPGRPGRAAARRPDRGEGPLRRRRRPDDRAAARRTTTATPACEDSAVVAKLRAAGAIIVAKTNQHELACGATTLISSAGRASTRGTPHGSPAGRPAARAPPSRPASSRWRWAPTPEARSGSRRRSAATTGLKPTHGAVSLRGAMPMCPSLDTAGPLARSAEDCALVHSVHRRATTPTTCGRAPGRTIRRARLDGIRVGIPRSYFELIDTEVRVARRGGGEGARVAGHARSSRWRARTSPQAFGTFGTRLAEVAHCYRDLWDDDRITPNLAASSPSDGRLSAPDAFGGRELELQVRREFAEAFEHADVLLAPCTVFPAPRIDDTEIEVEGGTLDVHGGGCARLTMPVNVAGLPALALPGRVLERGHADRRLS